MEEGAHVHLQLPPASLFKFPPDASPPVLPAPSTDDSFASPFSLSQEWYNRLLAPQVPFAVAGIYMAGATLLNAYNQRRDHKPWAISQTRIFKVIVVAHNVLLTAFSYFTFLGMTRALVHAWPGWAASSSSSASSLSSLLSSFKVENGLAGVADAMCKIHGPRGLGDAASWNVTTGQWASANPRIYLTDAGLPDTTDVGRLWNEGLAFWGWMFYASKFYEIVDTLIILAKGKRCSTLQTYHHAGALLSMWAGIRYMSPPIWLFVLENSGIHVLMYTYYTLSALGIQVPQGMKRTLTTLQIGQFVVGTAYAMAHFFIAYTVPVRTPYTVTRKIVSAVTSTVTDIPASEGTAAAAASTIGKFGGLLKKIALRAAGEEGLAENVRDEHGEVFGREAEHLVETLRAETKYKDTWKRVSCLDSSGQTFAVLLNVVYLLPLTILFVRFFVRSYSNRSSSAQAQDQSAVPPYKKLTKSSADAARNVDRKVEGLGQGAENEVLELSDLAKQKISEQHLGEKIGRAEQVVGEKIGRAEQAVGEKIGQAKQKIGEQHLGEKIGRAEQAVGEKIGQAEQVVGEKIGQAEQKLVEVKGKMVDVKDKMADALAESVEGAARVADEKGGAGVGGGNAAGGAGGGKEGKKNKNKKSKKGAAKQDDEGTDPDLEVD